MPTAKVRGRAYRCDPSTETIVFNGRVYHRNPDAKQLHRRRYFWGRREYGNGKKIALHVAIWEHHNGPVPEGRLVHHKDSDSFFNDISNLECITYSEHGKIHKNGSHLDAYRDSKMYAHNCWHCGNEYQTFRKHRTKFCSPTCASKYRHKNRLSHETRVCIICGSEYRTDRYTTTRTCSPVCRARLCANNREARKAREGVQP